MSCRFEAAAMAVWTMHYPSPDISVPGTLAFLNTEFITHLRLYSRIAE